MLKSILTLGLIGALAAPALADRGGRYGGYRGGPRTSVGLSFGFSNYGYGSGSFFGVNVGRGYGGGGYYGGYRSYAPLCRPPVIVERPVYVAPPPPVVYAPPPSVYYGGPSVYAPAPVYSPPPVYVAPPVYAPPPAYYYNGYGAGRYYYGR